jgi:hypothetical protein
MMRVGSNSLARVTTRGTVARRQLSSAPKMHKAKDFWPDMKSKRPVDHDDLHVRVPRPNSRVWQFCL